MSEVKDVSNTVEVTTLRAVLISKKVKKLWDSLNITQQNEAEGQMLADEIKHRGEKAVLNWLNELKELK